MVNRYTSFDESLCDIARIYRTLHKLIDGTSHARKYNESILRSLLLRSLVLYLLAAANRIVALRVFARYVCKNFTDPLNDKLV